MDPKILQSFLAVCELRSFSQAARLRGLSQPTITQHVQRLEALAGTAIFVRSRRGITLTSTGEALRLLAARFEEAHKDILKLLRAERTLGRIRFGAAEDFAATQLPMMLRAFTSTHPEVAFSLSVQEHAPLIDALKSEELDLILVKQFDDHSVSAFERTIVSTDRLVWVGDPAFECRPEQQVPLVTYRAPSVTREIVIGALNTAKREWRAACECQGSNGIIAAIRAGLGIGALPLSLVPRDLSVCSPSYGLPDLGKVHFVLLRRQDVLADDAAAVQALAEVIMRSVLRTT